MLIIRLAQQVVINRVAREKFERKLLAHCRKFFPAKTKLDDDPTLLGRISSAIDEATALGASDQATVARYVNLVFVWGLGFTKRRELPWAAKIARSPELRPEVKIHQLAARTKKELAAPAA